MQSAGCTRQLCSAASTAPGMQQSQLKKLYVVNELLAKKYPKDAIRTERLHIPELMFEATVLRSPPLSDAAWSK